MATIKRPRRFYLGKRFEAACLGDTELEGFWRWKQEQELGVALPATFPLLTRLTEKGYTTQEDLDGADEDELGRVEFSVAEAKSILGALALLLTPP